MLLSDNEFKSWLELLERLVEVKQSLATVDSIVSSDHFSNEPVSVSIPTPQIAVFGDQSSGKSSLLESISGIPFPKGRFEKFSTNTVVVFLQVNYYV